MPQRPRVQSFRLLRCTSPAEGPDGLSVQRDGALSRRSLRRALDDLSVGLRTNARNGQIAALEVHFAPPQAEDFAPSQPDHAEQAPCPRITPFGRGCEEDG